MNPLPSLQFLGHSLSPVTLQSGSFPTLPVTNPFGIRIHLVHSRLCPSESLSKRYFQKQLCPTIPLFTWDSIQTNSAHYRPCPNVISENNSVPLYPSPSRAPSKPPSSVHQRICPSVIPKSQLCPCPPGTQAKSTLSTVDSVH